MVRRFYITGGNNVGDPAALSNSITDPYFTGKVIRGVFKEGFRYWIPGLEWTFSGDTVTITSGDSFGQEEVIAVEVSTVAEVYNGEDDYTPEDPDCIEPYLPDIIKLVTARVNAVFEARETDPFSVFYDKGLYNQVGNDRLKTGDNYLTVWFIMPYSEDAPRDGSYYADAAFDVIIAIKTEANYTQAEREETNFFPRLIPVYKEFIRQLKRETKLENDSFENIYKHTKRFLPYWGGGDIAAPGAQNLWKNNADCIMISGLKVKISNTKCCTFLSNILN